MRTITTDQQINVSGQNATYREHSKTEDGRHTLRIEIKTDSHKPQQHAVIDHWDGTQWHRVASLLPEAIQTEGDLAYKRNRPSPSDFDKDRTRLLAMAASILGVERSAR